MPSHEALQLLHTLLQRGVLRVQAQDHPDEVILRQPTEFVLVHTP